MCITRGESHMEKLKGGRAERWKKQDIYLESNLWFGSMLPLVICVIWNKPLNLVNLFASSPLNPECHDSSHGCCAYLMGQRMWKVHDSPGCRHSGPGAEVSEEAGLRVPGAAGRPHCSPPATFPLAYMSFLKFGGCFP